MSSQAILNEIVINLQKHLQSPSFFKDLTLQQFVDQVEAEQCAIAEKFGLENIKVRQLNPDTIQQLLNLLQREQGGRFFFRHGDQDPGLAMSCLNPAEKKIAMMQAQHNMEDPITEASAVEFLATLWTIAYLKIKNNYQITVNSSANLRAKQPAEAIAKGCCTEVKFDEQLTCINYPDLPYQKLLEKLNNKDGNLPWKEQIVDEIIGEGVYQQITKAMQAERTKPTPINEINLNFTHTQQIQVLLQTDLRLSYYGFVFCLRESNQLFRFDDGLYSKMTILIEKKQVTNASRIYNGI